MVPDPAPMAIIPGTLIKPEGFSSNVVPDPAPMAIIPGTLIKPEGFRTDEHAAKFTRFRLF